MSKSCYLERSDGTRVRVGRGGILLGRAMTCDLILPDRRASRAHALVRIGPNGPEVIPLSRNPILVGGQEVSGLAALADGVRLGLPGEELVVRCAAASTEPLRWLVKVDQGPLLGVPEPECALGGGGDGADDIAIPGVPVGALHLRVVQSALLVTSSTRCTADDEPLEPQEMRALLPGSSVHLGEHRLTFFHHVPGHSEASTVPLARMVLPSSVHFRFLPRGAELTLGFPDGEKTVELPELRARLVAALLSPKAPYKAGDFVPDEVVIPSVWPCQAEKGNRELNLLLHRVRTELADAGVNPMALIERLKGGGALRFALTAGTPVLVE